MKLQRLFKKWEKTCRSRITLEELKKLYFAAQRPDFLALPKAEIDGVRQSIFFIIQKDPVSAYQFLSEAAKIWHDPQNKQLAITKILSSSSYNTDTGKHVSEMPNDWIAAFVAEKTNLKVKSTDVRTAKKLWLSVKKP